MLEHYSLESGACWKETQAEPLINLDTSKVLGGLHAKHPTLVSRDMNKPTQPRDLKSLKSGFLPVHSISVSVKDVGYSQQSISHKVAERLASTIINLTILCQAWFLLSTPPFVAQCRSISSVTSNAMNSCVSKSRRSWTRTRDLIWKRSLILNWKCRQLAPDQSVVLSPTPLWYIGWNLEHATEIQFL